MSTDTLLCRMFPLLLFLIITSLCKISLTANATSQQAPLLLLVSLDGLRYDFLTPDQTPNLWSLGRQGVFAPHGLKTQVYTVTTPNHHSMVTGLYQESHGLISNTFYDPKFGDFFDNWNFGMNRTRAQNSLQAKWYRGTPIWRANMGAKGQGRKSACQFWPVCEAQYDDQWPAHKSKPWKYFGYLDEWKREVDELLSWFTSPSDPVNLVLYYNAEPDHKLHDYGIESYQAKFMIKEVDRLIGYLKQKINESEYLNRNLNLILTSDHGHIDVPYEFYSWSFLWRYVRQDRVIESGPSFFPRLDLNVTVEEIVRNLTRAKAEGIPIQTWLKKDFPEKYHFKNNDRVGPVIYMYDLDHINRHKMSGRYSSDYFQGNHGFLNDHQEMNAFFIAYGPAFKSNYIVKNETIIENIDLYPLMCKILKIDPVPANNGSLARIESILNS